MVIPYFNPRSPCGERPQAPCGFLSVDCISIHALLAESDAAQTGATAEEMQISIHALLAESDDRCSLLHRKRLIFQSTLSLRRATKRAKLACISIFISIHALLAESDHYVSRSGHIYQYFNPRSPCGERHIVSDRVLSFSLFQSTLSLRRATSSGSVV